jgi:hypothetical protein
MIIYAAWLIICLSLSNIARSAKQVVVTKCLTGRPGQSCWQKNKKNVHIILIEYIYFPCNIAVIEVFNEIMQQTAA